MTWTTSTYCDIGATCVEWRKASECSADADCVEVACGHERYLIRDSKDPDGPVLTFTRDEWAAFVAGVRAGEFDA
jgi:hypothetical protein